MAQHQSSRIRRRKRLTLLLRDGPICQLCKREFPSDELTLDHIYPRSRGGGNRYANLQLLCQPCNEAKADTVPEELA